LFKATKRLHTAYLLKESFGQLWDYETPGWALRFFEQWRASVKWQRLKPYLSSDIYFSLSATNRSPSPRNAGSLPDDN
jgi:hypothetical protein